MAINFAFKDDRKLQKLALVSIATKLWGINDIQHQIHSHFIKKIKCTPRTLNWNKITGNVLCYFKQLITPTVTLSQKIENEIVNAIISIGERIFYWIEYLTEHLKVELAYSQRIYFTRHGTIDEIKIFNSFWAKNPILNNITSFNKGIYLLSCLFAQKDFINSNKDVMIAQLKRTKKVPVSTINKYQDKCFLLITASVLDYLQRFDLSKKGKKLVKQLKNKSGAVISPDDMYEVCVAYGLFEASEYYFDKMSAVMMTVPMMSANACLKGMESLKEVNCYRRGKFTDLFILSISMVRQQDTNFFMTRHLSQCLQVLLIWPLQNFYYTFLEQVKNHLTEKEPTFEDNFPLLIKTITDFIIEDGKAKLPVRRDFYRDVLKRTWDALDGSSKVMVCTKGASLKNLFDNSEFSTLGLVIDLKNPPDNGSDEFNLRTWKIGDKIFDSLKKENFELLSKFVREAFNTEEDRDIFKDEIVLYFTMKIIIDGDVDKADKILNWMASSKEDLPILKNKLNQKRIVNSLMSKKDFPTIAKFFDWLSFSPEEVTEFKRDLIKDNENSIKEFLTHVMYARFQHQEASHARVGESLNNFLKFCGVKQEEINEIKKKIREVIHEWIRYFAIEKLGLGVVDTVVYWIFDQQESAEEVIKDFLDSSDGVVLANEIIDYLEYNPQDYVFTFINEWMPLARDREGLKRRMIESRPAKQREVERVFDAIEVGGLYEEDVEGNFYSSSDEEEVDCPKPKPKLPIFSSESSDEDMEAFFDMMGGRLF